MQAITTKYISPSNTKGARIKAECERGSVTVSYPYDLNHDEQHALAVTQLCAKFAEEDKKQYGTPIAKNPWLKPKICGGTKTGYVFVFLP